MNCECCGDWIPAPVESVDVIDGRGQLRGVCPYCSAAHGYQPAAHYDEDD